MNGKREHEGLEPIKGKAFLDMVKEKAQLVEMTDAGNRSVNEGFSGGRRSATRFSKWPCSLKLASLDDTDSGLISMLASCRKCECHALARTQLVITHYQRLLDYIVPDFVHVLVDGRIVRSGGKELALELEEKGYDWIKEDIVA